MPNLRSHPGNQRRVSLRHPDRIDGVSEYRCASGHRWGRFSGKVLADNETEGRYGEASRIKPQQQDQKVVE